MAASAPAVRTLRSLVLVVVILPYYVASVIFSQRGIQGKNLDENAAIEFLNQYEMDASLQCNHLMLATWDFETNLTEYNRQRMLSFREKFSKFHENTWATATQFAWRNMSDARVQRIFSFLTILGRSALPINKRNRLSELIEEMRAIYKDTAICPYDPSRYRDEDGDYNLYADYNEIREDYDIECVPTLRIEPELTEIMANSRDPLELRYVWRAWRDAVGNNLKRPFLEYALLSNEGARLNRYDDQGQFWRAGWEIRNLEEVVDRLWAELRPLYEQLHAYVRRRLYNRYGESVMRIRGPIPAHLLGNMWGQSWTNLLDLTIPFPTERIVDVTDTLRRRAQTPTSLFAMANDFQVSMGLEPMPASFWKQSIFEKPRDRTFSCHASAWDFCNARDYRIKQCTEVTQEELINAHHELGHIQYNMQYRDQRFVFREGANPAFHEAVGDVFALSASTPENMQRLRLLDPIELSFESDINYLFTKALDKVAFLPFSYLVDKFRYEVFRGTTWQSNLNKRWWEWRLWAQGVTPPIPRDDDDFDAGSKYHVTSGTPYIKNFLSMVLQFQLHSELCRVSGHQGPLHRCNLYGSREAGKLLSSVMRLGKSRPWNEVISTLTGGRNNTFEARPMLEYFSQLHNWLRSQNRDEYIGWNIDDTVVSPLTGLSTATVVTLWVLGIIFGIILFVLCIIVVKRCKRADRDVNAASGAAS